MNKIGQSLEDKLELFRISGKHPSYIGLSEEAHEKLNEEMRPMLRYRSVAIGKRITEFAGVPVITMGGTHMPQDGIYIHPME